MAAVFAFSVHAHQQFHTGVFGGGPFYHQAKEVVPLIKEGGFTTVILWTLHVNQNGDLIFNDELIIKDGTYVGNREWPEIIARLKGNESSVTRVEFSVGSWGVLDFETIGRLIQQQGTGATSILHRNFAALKRTLPILDAINFDDESNYDFASSLSFSLMLGSIGFKVSFSPYTNVNFWRYLFAYANFVQPNLVDAIYLQGYGGGSGAQPSIWNRYFHGVKVQLGLWSLHGPKCMLGQSPMQMQSQLKKHAKALSGAWIWLLDDMLKCQQAYSISDYARAIGKLTRQ